MRLIGTQHYLKARCAYETQSNHLALTCAGCLREIGLLGRQAFSKQIRIAPCVHHAQVPVELAIDNLRSVSSYTRVLRVRGELTNRTSTAGLKSAGPVSRATVFRAFPTSSLLSIFTNIIRPVAVQRDLPRRVGNRPTRLQKWDVRARTHYVTLSRTGL